MTANMIIKFLKYYKNNSIYFFIIKKTNESIYGNKISCFNTEFIFNSYGKEIFFIFLTEMIYQ